MVLNFKIDYQMILYMIFSKNFWNYLMIVQDITTASIIDMTYLMSSRIFVNWSHTMQKNITLLSRLVKLDMTAFI